jgi:WD40 repeat protein/predicted Ser/Thr protein kinase
MSLESGALLAGRYRIDRVLGKGGFGAVYLAQDESLGVSCAVKENLSLSPETERQFRREANLLANLRHAHLPRVTNHFILSGQQYLVMDFVEGEDLKQLLTRDGFLPAAEVLKWAAQICDALSYLHGHTPPVIHRDIKPANIKLTTAGDAVLVDFGIAKTSAAGQQTTTSAMGLTPGFAPPEQYGTGGTDGRTDEYALAATLYLLLSGKLPPDSMERLLGAAALESLASLCPDLPPQVNAAIMRALSINPDERFLCVADFKAALLGEMPVEAIAAESLSVECFSDSAALAENVTTPAPRYSGAGESQWDDPATRPHSMAAAPAEPAAQKTRRRSPRWLWACLAVAALLGGLALLMGLGVFSLASFWPGVPALSGLAGARTATLTPSAEAALPSPMVAASATFPEPTALLVAAESTPTLAPLTQTLAPVATPAGATPSPEPGTLAPSGPATAVAERSDVTLISAANAPYLARRASLGPSSLVPYALSSDGKFVALTNASGVDVVELASGKTARHLESFWGRTSIVAVAVLSDSLLIQSPDLINRWSFAAGTFRKYPLTGHALYLSGDARTIVVPDKYGQIVDLDSGRQLASNQGNPKSYYQLTPDGAFLAWVDPGNQPGSLNLVQWVEVTTGKTVRMLAGHGKPLGALAVSADGQRLFSASGDIWDTASGKLLATFDCSAARIAVSADGQVILASDGELYDAVTGAGLGRLENFNAASLAFTSDGTRLIVQSGSKDVEVWGVDSGRLEAAQATPQAAANVATTAAPLGETISPSNTARLTIQGWWGTDRWLETRLIQDASYNAAGHPAAIFGGAYTHVAFRVDGRRFVGVSGGAVDIVDIATRKVVDRLDGLGRPAEAVFLGDKFVLISTGAGEVERWELATHKVKQTYSIAGHSLAASPDGKKFALQDKRFVYVVDVVTGEAPQASSDPNCIFLFTPDSRYLASTSGVNVGLWDVTSHELKVLPGKLGVKTAGLVFSADGRELISATGDIWDWQTLKWLRKFAGGAARVAVSPDGRLIIGNTGALYDGASGQLIGSLLDVRSQADALTFTPDGGELIWHTPQGVMYILGLNASAAPAPTIPAAPEAISGANAANLALQTRWGKGRLWSAQWSPDEKYLAVNTSLNTIIYEADTLTPVQTFWGSLTLAVGLDHQAAVVNSDGLKIIDIPTGRELLPMAPLPGIVAAAFSSDGSRLAIVGQVLATGPSDGMAVLNVADGNVSVLDKGWGRYKVALGATFSPDGKYLAVTFRGAAWVWEMATSKAHPVIPTVTLPAQFSPDSQYLAYFTDRQMMVVKAASGNPVFSANVDGTPYFPSSYEIDAFVPLNLRYLADGSLAVFYQTQRGHAASLARWPIGLTGATPLMPDILLSNFVGLDSLRGTFAGEYDANHTYRIPLLELSAAGKKFFSLTADGVARVWEAASGRQLAATPPDYLARMTLSLDGQTAALVNALGNVDLLDLTSGRVGGQLPSHLPKALMYNSPSVLMQLYPGGEEGDHLGVMNPAQKSELEDVAGAYFSDSRDFSMSRDGRLLAFWTVVNYQDVLGVFTLSLAQPLFTLGKFNAAQYTTAFSPDGRYLARVNGTHVEFWNIQTRQLEKDKTLTGKRALQGNLAFSADGQRLVAASGEVWDVAAGKLLANFASQTRQVAFSPNGQVIAGLDGSVWEADTGRLLGQLPGRLGAASQIVFTADGRRLVWQTQTGIVQVWGIK